MPQSVVTCLAMNCFGSQSPSKWKDREFSVRSRCFKFTGGKCIWPKDVAAQAWCEDTGSRSRGAQHVDVHLAVDACPFPAFYVDNPQCCRRPPSQPLLRSAGRDRDGTVCPAPPPRVSPETPFCSGECVSPALSCAVGRRSWVQAAAQADAASAPVCVCDGHLELLCKIKRIMYF